MASRITEITFFVLLLPLAFSMINVWGVFDQQYYGVSQVEYQGYTISNLSEYKSGPTSVFDYPAMLLQWALGAVTAIITLIAAFFVIYPQLIALFPEVPSYVWLIINVAYWFNFVLFFWSLKYPAIGEGT